MFRQKLTRHWGVLGPKLAGKLHVFMGGEDTFYLEGATRLLKQSLTRLGSDAVIEIQLANGLSSSQLHAGQTLLVPTP